MVDRYLRGVQGDGSQPQPRRPSYYPKPLRDLARERYRSTI
jgi:hypothetical protein